MGSLSIEEYIKERIEKGLIASDLQPLMCECGCKKFKKVDNYYDEGYIIEYSLECTNEKCLNIVGNWSYGYWQI